MQGSNNKYTARTLGILLLGGWIAICSFGTEPVSPKPYPDKQTDGKTRPDTAGVHPRELVFPGYFGHHFRIPRDNPETTEGIALGRMLFYEKALSADNTISCASCHQQAHAFSDTLAFSEGVGHVQQSRNTMALVNLLWVSDFFWDGRTRGLEHQADTPLTHLHEMGQSFAVSVKKLSAKKVYAEKFRAAFGDPQITRDRIEKALAQFERTLISSHSRYDLYLQHRYRPSPEELAGIQLFYGTPSADSFARRPACGHCHGGPRTFEELYANNGLDSICKDLGREAVSGADYDRGRFRVVTLRNIALTAPYMHDGRFSTLSEVIDHYSAHIIQSKTLSPFLQSAPPDSPAQPRFSDQEKKDLLAFLRMLTDSAFITDPRFSDPFIGSSREPIQPSLSQYK